MSGPSAEGGPLPAADLELLAKHERDLADWDRRINGRIPVLAVHYDSGEWIVEITTDEGPGEDPSKVRLSLAYERSSLEVDVPLDVLHQIAERIRELWTDLPPRVTSDVTLDDVEAFLDRQNAKKTHSGATERRRKKT